MKTKNRRRNQKIFLVIPTIRNLDFLLACKNQFSPCHLLIIEDGPKPTVIIPKVKVASIRHFCWQDIDQDFGKNSWIFSRKNAGIRSYGFWKAHQLDADIIFTLDDDCYPAEAKFIEKHLDNLNFQAPTGWFPTYPDPKWLFTRGIPYQNRHQLPVMISHGLWSGALDLDAKTEIKLPKLLNEKPYPPLRQIIPFGYFYPMCTMNLAFRRQVTPLMFLTMMGKSPSGNDWEFNRYDDIWAGLFSKKIMDHLGWGIISGSPFVDHRKASLTTDNFKKEMAGLKMNETLWQIVDQVKLTQPDPKSCYRQLASKAKFPKTAYFKKLRQAMTIWANLF